MGASLGRPSDYSQDLIDRICDWLAEGTSLRRICAREDMPSMRTVLRWLAQHELFRAQYALAREAQADTLADEIVDIADDALNDYVQTDDGPQINPEAVQRAKLRVDARKWVASKLKPKKYGERLDLAHSGEVTHKHMTLAQFAERIREAKVLSGRVVEPEAIEGGEGELNQAGF